MYLVGLVFAAVGAVSAVALTALWMRGPRIRTEPAMRPFEAGAEPKMHAWNQHHVRYLPYALIFILFDMEMVFMYPWAVVFFEVGWKAMAEMGMFITILVLGILYAWRERAFEWE